MERHSLIIAAAAIAVSAVLAAACVRKPVVETAEIVTTQSAGEEETTKAWEATTQAEETAQTQPEQKKMHHMFQGMVTKVTGDGSVFTPQADDGKDYDIRQSEIRDVEVDIKEDVYIAVAYIGEPLGELKDVILVVALPEQEEWNILTEKGVTTANAVGSFSMKTDDRQEFSFLKDNHPTEDGVLAGDSGDKIRVIYVNSQGANYPVEIRLANWWTYGSQSLWGIKIHPWADRTKERE